MSVPVLTDITSEEKRIAELQIGFATRLRKSPYYIVEKNKSTGEPNYSRALVAILTHLKNYRVILINIGRQRWISQH